MQMLFKCIIISFLSLETVQVLNAAETGGKSIRDDDIKNTSDINDNGQKCLASNGKPCHFPFKVHGKVHRTNVMVLKVSPICFQVYTSCVETTSLLSFDWCSTKGEHFNLKNLYFKSNDVFQLTAMVTTCQARGSGATATAGTSQKWPHPRPPQPGSWCSLPCPSVSERVNKTTTVLLSGKKKYFL